ncbi:hypothetical protein JCM5353_004335 [Sporobolomyces roseus]
MAQDYAGTALGLSHLAVGASSLLSPSFTSSLFLLSYHPTSSFITRLFGSRDLILGYSIFSSPPTTSQTLSGDSRRKWAIQLANLINGLDVLSAVVEYIKSDCTDQGALIGGLGAAVLVGLGWMSLNGKGGGNGKNQF